MWSRQLIICYFGKAWLPSPKSKLHIPSIRNLENRKIEKSINPPNKTIKRESTASSWRLNSLFFQTRSNRSVYRNTQSLKNRQLPSLSITAKTSLSLTCRSNHSRSFVRVTSFVSLLTFIPAFEPSRAGLKGGIRDDDEAVEEVVLGCLRDGIWRIKYLPA